MLLLHCKRLFKSNQKDSLKHCCSVWRGSLKVEGMWWYISTGKPEQNMLKRREINIVSATGYNRELPLAGRVFKDKDALGFQTLCKRKCSWALDVLHTDLLPLAASSCLQLPKSWACKMEPLIPPVQSISSEANTCNSSQSFWQYCKYLRGRVGRKMQLWVSEASKD